MRTVQRQRLTDFVCGGADGKVVLAFESGVRAAKADMSRASNPYMPEYEQDLWESWNCGYNEADPRYSIADNFKEPTEPERTPSI